MKVDPVTGRIAYHSIRFREDGTGSDLVQYDFDGSVESITPYSRYNLSLPIHRPTLWQRLFGMGNCA